MTAKHIHEMVHEADLKTSGGNEMENLTKTKLYSGRFLLCVAGCIAFLALNAVCCYGVFVTIKQPDVNPAIITLITLQSNFLTAIATFYFTIRRTGEK